MGQIKGINPVVIDTNVIISAFLFGGIPAKLIALWKSKKIRPHASRQIIDEYLRVLAYPKFKLSTEEIHYILHQEILAWFEIVSVKMTSLPVIIPKDPSDDIFIRCAEAAKIKTIISGDQHLLSMEHYGDIEVVSPVSFLQRSASDG